MMSPLRIEVMSHHEVRATLFVASGQGFYTPPDWQLDLIQDARLWFNDLMLAPRLYSARSPRRDNEAAASACLAAACG